MSIRLRLILWHSTVFFAGLLMFAGVVWVGTRAVLHRETDTWLMRQADGLEQFLRLETHGSGESAVAEEAREFSTGLPQGAGIRLFNDDGVQLFSSPDIAISVAADTPTTVFHDGQPIRAVSRSVQVKGHDFRFAMWRSEAQSKAALADLRFVLLLMIPVILMLAIAGGWFLSRHAFRPVDEMTEAARRISLHNLSSKLPVPQHDDELRRLCEAWNEMLQRLDASANQLRQFSADASHELRTPIAFIRTTAELALKRNRSEEDYREVLRKIQDRSTELSRLIESLMELARADMGQSSLSFAPLDVTELIEDVRTQVEPVSVQRNVAFSIQASERLVVVGDRDALRRVLLLLLDNAIKFTPASGKVQLRATGASNDVVVFEVEDTGIGIAPHHLPRIFDRFFQVDGARSCGGIGLGLSVAQWIVHAHRGRIEVVSELQRGALFRVVLPGSSSKEQWNQLDSDILARSTPSA